MFYRLRLLISGTLPFVLGFLCFALSACKSSAPPAPPPPPPAPVTIATAISRDVPIYLDEIGKTVATEFVTIQPQVSGQIMGRHFVDGADIKNGELLFTIDKRPYQDKVAEAEANLEESRAALEIALADYHRTEKAFNAGAASVEDVDTKKGTLDSATAQVKVSQSALDTANLNLSFCTIYSPIDGRAGARMVDVGNIVTANTTNLLTIQRISPIYADFTITERDLPNVRARMAEGDLTTLISLPQAPNLTHSANLTFLDNSIQSNAGRIRLRATLLNQDRYFWPGQFVNVRLVLSVKKDAVLIPYVCTQLGQQGPYVYIVKSNNTVEQRPVTIGQRQGGDDDLVVILTGIAANEGVVRTGQLTIGPGATVKILNPPPATSPASSQPSPGDVQK